MIETLADGTKFETFEESEAASTPEQIEMATALCNKLGLSGQRTMVRCRFREMTQEENVLYGLLCPTRTKIENYSASQIPLRVLVVAEHAVESAMFDHLEIWHPEVVKRDPVLVGCTHKNDWETGAKLFILARWGAELDELPALARQWKEKALAHMRSIEAQVKNTISVIEAGGHLAVRSFAPSYSAPWLK